MAEGRDLSTLESVKELKSRDYSKQTRAARVLGETGTLNEVLALCEVAVNAKGFGVRLASATAAAEIVYRERAQVALDGDLIEAIVAMIRFVDPETSPALLLVLGAIGQEREVVWLGRLLRDPRTTVRVAALAALRRMILSHECWGREDLRQCVADWLGDERLAMDVRAELVWICSEIGWPIPHARHCGVPKEVRIRESTRRKFSAWTGLWISNGRDVWAPGEASEHWLAIGGGWIASLEGPPSGIFVVEDEAVCTHWSIPMRMVWAPMIGEPGRKQAIQGHGKTWYRANDRAIEIWLKETLVSMDESWAPILQDWLEVGLGSKDEPTSWGAVVGKALMKW